MTITNVSGKSYHVKGIFVAGKYYSVILNCYVNAVCAVIYYILYLYIQEKNFVYEKLSYLGTSSTYESYLHKCIASRSIHRTQEQIGLIRQKIDRL